MFVRFLWPLRSLALVLGLLLSTAASGFALEPDPAFARYVDVELLASAWERKDPELLTDLALQMQEGERVLLRSHKDISSDQVFAMAVKVAGDKRDVATLKRLVGNLEKAKKTELAAEAKRSLRLASEKRAVEPALTLQIDQVSPAVFLAMQELLDDIKAARDLGDRSAFDAIMKRAAEAKVLSEPQRRALLKLAAEAREAMPEKEEVNPAQKAMNKLLADSRPGPRPGPAPAPRPQPAPVHHNPPPVHHNPPPPVHYNPPPPVHYNPPPPVHYNPPPPVHYNPPPVHNNPPPVHNNPPPVHNNQPPVVWKPPVVFKQPVRPNRPNNTVINNTVINNVTRVRYNVTNLGFVIGGSVNWNFTRNWHLDPGECIISIGGVNCAGSGLSLQQLINQAYQGGNLTCVIRTVDGNNETTDLDPPDGGDNQGGGGDNGGGNAFFQSVRYLTIKNSTGEELTINVQYLVLNEQNDWTWLPNPPGGPQVLRYTVADGALTNLLVNNERVAAGRVRIWATSPSGKQWNGNRDNDLVLVSEPYNSAEIGVFTFTFNP